MHVSVDIRTGLIPVVRSQSRLFLCLYYTICVVVDRCMRVAHGSLALSGCCLVFAREITCLS